MNMRKKLREFFTMTRRAEEGFTLVELIVVIAIVAILGGVAVPAYSGYIEKADRAADAQILADMNKAFAAACMVKGVDNYNASGAKASIGENRKIAAVEVSDVEGFNDTFVTFFDNEGKFEFFTQLFYSPDDGGFVGDISQASGDVLISYGDGFVRVSNEAVQALLNSTFYGEGMTSEKLLNQVDVVASIAGGMGSVANVMATEGYVDAALKSLGITPTGSLAEKTALMQAKAKELALKKMGITESELGASNQEQYKAILADISNNALVLYTAQSTSQMTAEEAKGLLNGVNSTLIKKAMDGELTEADKAKGMNQAALAYGMYYAYVNSNECTKDLEKNDITADMVIEALDNNQEFQSYMTGPQGTKDMEAYLQALSVINSSTQSPAAVEKLVVEGFNDPNLIAILTQSTGK